MRDLDGNRYGVNTEPIKGSEEASGGVVGSEEQMTAETDQTDIDPGLFICCSHCVGHGIDTDVETVRQLCGSDPVGVAAMLRCARGLGLKTRATTATWAQLSNASMPVVAVLRQGGFILISKVIDGKVFAVQPHQQPRTLMRAELEEAWDGRLAVIEHRGSLSSFGHRLIFQLTNMATRVRVLAQHVGQFLMPAATAIDEPPFKPTVESAEAHPDDPGLAALVMLLRCHGIGAESAQIRHRCGTVTIGITEMLHCAKDLGLKARAPTTNWDRLASTPLPGIAGLRDGGFLILGKVAEGKVLIQQPSSPRPEVMTRARFETVWDGRLVLWRAERHCRTSRAASTSHGFWGRSTSTAISSARCW